MAAATWSETPGPSAACTSATRATPPRMQRQCVTSGCLSCPCQWLAAASALALTAVLALAGCSTGIGSDTAVSVDGTDYTVAELQEATTQLNALAQQPGEPQQVVADLVADLAQRPVEDAVGIGETGAAGVQGSGHAEDHDAAEPERDGGLDGLLDAGIAGGQVADQRGSALRAALLDARGQPGVGVLGQVRGDDPIDQGSRPGQALGLHGRLRRTGLLGR